MGDEGNAPASRKDTAIYQELVELSAKLGRWQDRNKNDFDNDEQKEKAERIGRLMDELCDDLGAE